MSENTAWGPAPRSGKVDWSAGAGGESAPAWEAPAAPTSDAGDDGLDDLFDDAPLTSPTEEAPSPWGAPLVAAPLGAPAWGAPGAAPATAWGTPETPPEAAPAAAWGTPEADADGLDDLFSDDAPEESAAETAPAAVMAEAISQTEDVDGLDDLFGDDPAEQETPAGGQGTSAAGQEDQPGPEEEETAAAGWAAVPPPPGPSLSALASLSAPRPIPKAEKKPKAAPAAPAEVKKPVETAPQQAVQQAPQPEPAPQQAPQPEPAPQQAPQPEPAPQQAPQPEPAPQQAPQAAAQRPGRLDLAGRRREAEAASFGLVDAEVMQMAQQYAVPEHLWVYVDRLLGYVASSADVQNVVNLFVLTRDKVLDSEQRRRWQDVIAPRLIDANVNIQNPMEGNKVFDLAYDELIGISVLGPLWRDESITEILVDGWDKVVIERGSRLIDTPLRFRDSQHASRVARELASKVSDRALTPTNPLVTARLPGARVTFAYGAVVKSGLSISLRKFVELLGIEKLLEYGAVSEEMVEFLQECVVARANVLVSGGTGTGKTTQINALSQFIPDEERVITIEDAFELQLSNRHVVALQTKEKASADDQVVISQAELLVNTLRMRPDRVIVGEIREGQGAVVMLQAANTGHDGTMTTIHAQTSEVALNERLADMVMSVTGAPSDVVRRSVASAIDLVVQVTRKHGRRFISEISVVDRTCVSDGVIEPDRVFVGEVSPEGEVRFRHVGGVRPDTDLGSKLADAGFNVTKWEPRP